MLTKISSERVDKKKLTVKLSYNPYSKRFFCDFWDIDEQTREAHYLVSINITEGEALCIGRELGIKILEQ